MNEAQLSSVLWPSKHVSWDYVRTYNLAITVSVIPEGLHDEEEQQCFYTANVRITLDVLYIGVCTHTGEYAVPLSTLADL